MCQDELLDFLIKMAACQYIIADYNRTQEELQNIEPVFMFKAKK